jgi:hypothetical protein
MIELSTKDYIAITIITVVCIVLFVRLYDKCRRVNPV